MKILQINIFGTLSTGRIAVDLHKILVSQGHKGIVAFGRGIIESDVPHIKVGKYLDVYYHAVLTRITGKTGFYSKKATQKFVKEIEQYNPDIVHLHNIHGYYINIEVLFDYLSMVNKPIVWTLHDCWAFTGHCAYFDYVGCYKWKTGCYICPQKKEYPKSVLFDNSKWNYEQKKRLFTSVKNMAIVTPSMWLAELAEQSFLGKYPIEVINNGIDLDVFKPTESDFRQKYDIEDKFIILGVASIWDRRKGLDTFIEMSAMLDDRYKIVLVGLNNKQLRKLPKNILGFARTESVKELAEIYSVADVFVNPTLEENFPTVNLEALACGTPIITYKTGGSIESIYESCGIVVEKGNINALKDAVEEVRSGGMFGSSDCVKRAKLYDKQDKFGEYVRLYDRKKI